MLDGNWNADGDEEMGEAPNSTQGFEGDHVDLYFEIPVGRIPASGLGEAETFLAKWKSYTGYDPDHFRSDYQHKMLSMAEVLFPDDWEVPDDPSGILLDGAEIAESTLVFLPECFEATRLYQNWPEYPGAIEETKDAVIEHFNQGFGLTDHIGHGFRANMSVGDGKLENVDADAFENTDAYSVLYAVNCTSGAIGFDCIVEQAMKFGRRVARAEIPVRQHHQQVSLSAHSELAQRAADVGFNRLRGDGQSLGDFGVRIFEAHQRDHLLFARGKPLPGNQVDLGGLAVGNGKDEQVGSHFLFGALFKLRNGLQRPGQVILEAIQPLGELHESQPVHEAFPQGGKPVGGRKGHSGIIIPEHMFQ